MPKSSNNSDLKIIGEYAFQNTPIEFMNSDNFIIGKTDPNGEYDDLVLVLDNFIDDLTIPQFIKKIVDFCFYKFRIESITIPQHVTKIGQ